MSTQRQRWNTATFNPILNFITTTLIYERNHTLVMHVICQSLKKVNWNSTKESIQERNHILVINVKSHSQRKPYIGRILLWYLWKSFPYKIWFNCLSEDRYTFRYFRFLIVDHLYWLVLFWQKRAKIIFSLNIYLIQLGIDPFISYNYQNLNKNLGFRILLVDHLPNPLPFLYYIFLENKRQESYFWSDGSL